ncbi:hypothetical protein SCHPADRAFT_525554 [Schizopora paradoxa]|uniref:Uncharacterized protein n=1 Tax=Schizopora paradoxa TaxID=27342 RepID=A0A0H2REN3_9AGAM|nr:hypothetical protein SCHPADRAFT_525554 [Schizopora paradoxa]
MFTIPLSLPLPKLSISRIADLRSPGETKSMPFKRETSSPFTHSNVEVIGVFRAPTISSIDSDATIDDQPGAGRTLGRYIAWLGSKLEKAANSRAERLGLGPKAIANKICCRAGHQEIWIEPSNTWRLHWRQLVVPNQRFNESQTKALRKLCRKLIKHASFPH